ncbi:15167_t:CDS:2, partial [Gigaspora margarita]
VLVSIKDASVLIKEAFVLIEEVSASIEEVLVLIKKLSKNLQRTKLILTIQQLPEKELPLANKLIPTMQYPKGPNEGKIILSYLQKKTYNYLSQSLYKPKSDYYSLQNSNLTEIRSLVQCSSQITNEEFHEKIKTIFNSNKNFYSSNTIWFVTNILQVGEPSRNWLSLFTLRTWHKDISELQFNKQIYQVMNALAFGIMLSNVIVAQLQNVIKCNANTVSDVIINHIQEYELDIKKCIIWTMDNTSYMSSDKKGAIALFNKKVNRNLLQIGCGLHIIQIIINHFEQEAFGILANTIGFSRKLHLYNLLYLT